jgi:bis(5'-nucleosyl)-tetraphosphatase (symmetrical)
VPPPAIGHNQGCHRPHARLLPRTAYDRPLDRLGLVGDLVNRGPHSLAVLRWARELGDRVVCVLGNHDMHLLARGWQVAHPKGKDTLGEVLAAPDRDELLDWLRRRPLLVREGDWVMVHGGLLPAWSIEEAERHARAAERALAGPDPRAFLAAWPKPIKVMLNMRTCRADGSMCSDHKGPPEQAPAGCLPWFSHPHARGAVTVVFGHWASLGYRRGAGYLALDTGCVWGGSLTAVRLDDGEAFHEPA